MTMSNVLVQLDDLPDEILLHIFRNLLNIEALFYLTDVNQRLNRIVHDPIFARRLWLLVYCPDNASIEPLPDLVLNRFCSEILPQIGHRVENLFLEATSMEQILCATSYPNLYGLALFNMKLEVMKSLFIDKISVLHIFKDQILSFCINFADPICFSSIEDVYLSVFTQIFTNFTNLRCLKFNPYSTCFSGLCFSSFPAVVSSNLLELHVCVERLSDCLYLLDGRFDQLRALYVILATQSMSPCPIEDRKKLLRNLQIFSLDGRSKMFCYDEGVVPLLQRMINLEELYLNLDVMWNDKLIDGNTLKKDILSYMPRLHNFAFNICLRASHRDQTNLPSTEDFQRTFEAFPSDQIIACVNHFQEAAFSHYRIYSYPYQLEFYDHITNNFPGGTFNSVIEVSMYDERPFEYEFFVRVAQSFPFLEDLIIQNQKPPIDKEWIKSNNNNQTLPIIEYPNLMSLDFRRTHDDYVELFLLDTKMSLPNISHLAVDYESLKRVTEDFTRNATRTYCQKLSFLYLYGRSQIDASVKNYFPHACIKIYFPMHQ